MEIRKLVTIVEEVRVEMGKNLSKPIRRAAAVVVIKNPFAGKYQEDLQELMDIGGELGGFLATRARDALGIKPQEVDSFGKGAIVGINGELEHGSAIIHPKFGNPVREAANGTASIPSVEKIGAVGTLIDIPLHHKDSLSILSHYDALQVCIQGSPRPDEILVAVAVTNSGRPLARIGGPKKRRSSR